MADNVVANPGAGGETFATDDVGGVQFPRTKIVIGADGVNDGDVSAANPMPAALTAQAVTGAVPAATPQMVVIGGIRRDGDSVWPGTDDGEFSPLLINRDGRVKVAGAPAQFDPVTGSITASAQTVSADVSSASNVMVYVTGTFAGHNCTFEGSIDGGANWFAVQAVRSNANTIETTTGVLGAAPAYAWELSVNALTNFRVRAIAHTSGTANWRFTLGSYATEPIPAAQVSGTQPVSGTVTANAGTGTMAVSMATNTPTLAAGTNLAADVGVQYRANATGAASRSHIVSAATTNPTVVKASAGRLLGCCLSNTNAAWRYVKFHNQTTSPTAGTGVVQTIGVPPNNRAQWNLPGGVAFSTGIAMTIVTGSADADATAVGVGDIVGDVFFA